MNHLYLHCFSGISGNMLLGAFLELGLNEKILRNELSKLPLTGYELIIEPVKKCGIKALWVDVKEKQNEHHHHDHHAHRGLTEISSIISSSALSSGIKEKSLNMFRTLGEAEAKVHGCSVEEIHFHEVGAIDSIIDIVGIAIAMEHLKISSVSSSPVHVGSGFVQCAHGLMPVPAPATAELLKKIPYYSGQIEKELTTPTGALFLKTFASVFGNRPQNFRAERIGYGAGTHELPIPNVLQAELGIQEDCLDQLCILETNLDDCSAQVTGYVTQRLLDLGANDVWVTPIMMKKNRPAVELSVLVTNSLAKVAEDLILSETTTIGIRKIPVQRRILNREIRQVTLPWGDVRVKVAYENGQIRNVMPEYEDCRQFAKQLDVPLKEIQQQVLEQARSLWLTESSGNLER